MSNKIFITGKPGIGKTTIIRAIAEELKSRGVGSDGFYTQEIRTGGIRTGFRIIGLKNFEGELAGTCITGTNMRVGKYFVRIDALEKCIERIGDEKVIIIDEIGRMELLSEKFESFIRRILGSDKTVIATVGEKFVDMFRGNAKVIRADLGNRDRLVKTILDEIYPRL